MQILNKLDGYQLTTPTFPTPPSGVVGVQAFPFEITVTTTSGGVAYFGGPSTGGRGSITVVPVTYTAGRTIKAATAGVPTGIAGCAAGISFTSAATPWTVTYGASLGTATGANATNVVCTGAVATLDLTPVVSASTYSNDTQGPTATGDQQAGTLANTFKTVSSSTTPVAAPASIRVDYVAPTGGAITIPANARGSLALTVSDGQRLNQAEQREARLPQPRSVPQLVRQWLDRDPLPPGSGA
jgi:hypothetical protein